MKNKKGFVFVETIVVLAVVALALTSVVATYSLVTSRSEIKDYYNNPSDLYLLYTISNLGADTSNNYTKISKSFWVTKSTCNSSMNTFITNCGNLFTNHNIENLGLIVDLEYELENNFKVYGNDTLDFLNSLKTYKDSSKTQKAKYLIAKIHREGKSYFAALEIEG